MAIKIAEAQQTNTEKVEVLRALGQTLAADKPQVSAADMQRYVGLLKEMEEVRSVACEAYGDEAFAAVVEGLLKEQE